MKPPFALLLLAGASFAAGPAVSVVNQKVETAVDLQAGTAVVRTVAWIRNASRQPATVAVRQELGRGTGWFPSNGPGSNATIPPGETARLEFAAALSREQVSLWTFDRPTLYRSRIVAGAATHTAGFGIRKIEIQGTQLLLNGYPIRLGGARLGPQESTASVDQELRRVKEAGLEMLWIEHSPASSAVLDWADRNGLLVVVDAGVAGPPESQRDWNHPSSFAWGSGDFVSVSLGGTAEQIAKRLDLAHARSPGKPVCVSDLDAGAAQFRGAIGVIRERPWVFGAFLRNFAAYPVREEHSAVVVKGVESVTGAVILRLASRADFPLYPPGEYELRLSHFDAQGRVVKTERQTITLSAPGAETTIAVPVKPPAVKLSGTILRNGFVTVSF